MSWETVFFPKTSGHLHPLLFTQQLSRLFSWGRGEPQARPHGLATTQGETDKVPVTHSGRGPLTSQGVKGLLRSNHPELSCKEKCSTVALAGLPFWAQGARELGETIYVRRRSGHPKRRVQAGSQHPLAPGHHKGMVGSSRNRQWVVIGCGCSWAKPSTSLPALSLRMGAP